MDIRFLDYGNANHRCSCTQDIRRLCEGSLCMWNLEEKKANKVGQLHLPSSEELEMFHSVLLPRIFALRTSQCLSWQSLFPLLGWAFSILWVSPPKVFGDEGYKNLSLWISVSVISFDFHSFNHTISMLTTFKFMSTSHSLPYLSIYSPT